MTAASLAQLRAETGDRPLLRVPEPTVADVGIGWSVQELGDVEWDHMRRGVVYDVGRVPDPESGELVERFTLVRNHRGRLVWCSLRADQATCPERPNAWTIEAVCQVAACELAKVRKDRNRALELWTLGRRLMGVLVAPGA